MLKVPERRFLGRIRRWQAELRRSFSGSGDALLLRVCDGFRSYLFYG